MDPNLRKEFIEAVVIIARMVPYGKVTTYGAIAKAAGFANLSRMTGKVISGKYGSFKNIPAHRILGSNGTLTGRKFFSVPGAMQSMLEQEGHTIVNNRVRDFKKSFWDPLYEL